MKVSELIQILQDDCHPDAEVLLLDMDWPEGHPGQKFDFKVDQCEEIGGPGEEPAVAIWASDLNQIVKTG